MTNRTRLPLPEPIGIVWADGRPHHTYTAYQMYEYADAENAALQERVKVLEDALQMAMRWLDLGATKEEWESARAALGDTND